VPVGRALVRPVLIDPTLVVVGVPEPPLVVVLVDHVGGIGRNRPRAGLDGATTGRLTTRRLAAGRCVGVGTIGHGLSATQPSSVVIDVGAGVLVEVEVLVGMLGVGVGGEGIDAGGDLEGDTGEQVGERVPTQLVQRPRITGRPGRPGQTIDPVERGRRPLRRQPHPGQRRGPVRLRPQLNIPVDHPPPIPPPGRLWGATMNVIPQPLPQLRQRPPRRFRQQPVHDPPHRRLIVHIRQQLHEGLRPRRIQPTRPHRGQHIRKPGHQRIRRIQLRLRPPRRPPQPPPHRLTHLPLPPHLRRRPDPQPHRLRRQMQINQQLRLQMPNLPRPRPQHQLQLIGIHRGLINRLQQQRQPRPRRTINKLRRHRPRPLIHRRPTHPP